MAYLKIINLNKTDHFILILSIKCVNAMNLNISYIDIMKFKITYLTIINLNIIYF